MNGVSGTHKTEGKMVRHDSAPQIAIVPEHLLAEPQLHGLVVRSEVVCFFDDVDAMKSDKSRVSASFDEMNKLVREEDGEAFGMVIVIPQVGPGRSLVPSNEVDKHSSDEMFEGLSWYSRASPENAPVKSSSSISSPRNAAIQGRVPEYIVRVCQATSLASQTPSSSNSEGILWRNVFMTCAIRSKPITSAYGQWLDVIFGFLALYVLAKYWNVLARMVDDQLAFEDRTLKERVEFVMSRHAPLGFKLNPQADFVLGNLVIIVVDAWQRFIAHVASFGKECVVVSFTMAILVNRAIGLSVFFAVAFDAFMILTTHLGVLHRVFARILRFQLRLLGSLSLLMRGKKRNMLRHRIDTLKTDSAQLMLGTMAGFFFTFTLQTTLAYHLLILAVWFVVFFIQCVLFFCVLCRSLPFDEIVTALRDMGDRDRGALRPSRFHLRLNEEEGFWELIVVPVSIQNVMSSWLKQVMSQWTRAWNRRWGNQKVFQNVLFGHELPSVPPPDF